jgi:hypothetical protein
MDNLVAGFRALGLDPPQMVPPDVDVSTFSRKITNHRIAEALGARESAPLIYEAEFCANLLDSFSEGGGWQYVYAAQARYRRLLAALPAVSRHRLQLVVGAVFNYFSFERVVADRIRQGDQFAAEEVAEYLLRRGSDSLIYGTLIYQVDGFQHPSLISGFRVRQALWDLADDVEDVEQDRSTIGANVLLLARMDRAELRRLAAALVRYAKNLTGPLKPLGQAVEEQYERTRAALN